MKTSTRFFVWANLTNRATVIGPQIVAAKHRDNLALRAARAYEAGRSSGENVFNRLLGERPNVTTRVSGCDTAETIGATDGGGLARLHRSTDSGSVPPLKASRPPTRPRRCGLVVPGQDVGDSSCVSEDLRVEW